LPGAAGGRWKNKRGIVKERGMDLNTSRALGPRGYRLREKRVDSHRHWCFEKKRRHTDSGEKPFKEVPPDLVKGGEGIIWGRDLYGKEGGGV